MNYFLTKIHINKIFHLQDFDIHLDTDSPKHLIITGKNGNGKTILINALMKAFERIFIDRFPKPSEYIDFVKEWQEKSALEKIGVFDDRIIQSCLYELELSFNDIISLSDCYNRGHFLFAFYEANRKPSFIEPETPTKPNLSQVKSAKDKKSDQFLHFLVDLKVQESLARNEGLTTDADEIKAWFNGFELLLKELFQDTNVRLEFQYKDYSFFINDGQKRFKLTELSDGYSAIMDIVADLILKMQAQDKLNRDYLQKGIVIIDEIETHLHLELQRLILPMLTRLFPNIQFIVTTHSPFVLSSLDNAIAYDLAKRVPLADLTDYSFETLAEGYFGVNSASSYLALKFKEFKKLAQQDKLSLGEQEELQRLDKEFDDLPETIAPSIKAEYLSVSLNAKNKNTL